MIRCFSYICKRVIAVGCQGQGPLCWLMAGNEYFCKNENDLFFLYKTRHLSQWLYMVISIDDIKDAKSLEAWLDERPEAVRRNCAVFIAARSALRVLPIAVDGIQFSD